MQNIITKKLEINFQKLLYLLGLMLLIGIFLIYAHVIMNAARILFSTDFFKFYQSTQFYFEGQNIYDKIIRPLNPADAAFFQQKILVLNSDLNPPFFTLLLMPMAWLSYYHALITWSIISMIATFVGILLVLSTFPGIWQNQLLRLWAFIGFLLYFPTYANIRFGQVSAILLLITAAAWVMCRKRLDARSGALLGLAFSIKLFYGLFLIYFAARKQWRALFYMSITYLVTALIALWFFGLQTYERYYLALKHIHWTSATWNASIFGFLIRIFGGNHEGNIPIVNYPQLTPILYWAISLALVVYLIITNWRSTKISSISSKNYSSHELNYLDWGFSLTIVAMLFITPLSWLYYFTLLLIPFITILRATKNTIHFDISFIIINAVILLSSLPCNYQQPKAVVNPEIALTWASYYFYALGILLVLILLSRKWIIQQQNESAKQSYSILSCGMQITVITIAALPSILSFIIAIH